jgi:hypothetical protein
MKKTLLTIIGLTAMASSAMFGQVLINNLNVPVTENFSTWNGSAVPTNFSASGLTTFSGFYNLDGAYLNSNAYYAFRDNSSSPVIGLGGKRGTSGGVFLNWSLTNNTGSNITEFSITWTAYQYTEWGRATTFTLNSYNPNGSGFTSVGVNSTTFTASAQASPTASSGVNLSTITSSSQSATITLATPLLDGQSILIGWSMGNGAGSQGNAHVGLSNISLTAIPEPSTAILLGLGAMAIFLRRKLASPKI